MFDEYEEACEAEITRETAAAEVARHGADWQEFLAAVGSRQFYRGKEVLDWLGY